MTTYGYQNPERVNKFSQAWYSCADLVQAIEERLQAWPNVEDPDDAVKGELIPVFEPDEEDLVRLRELENELNKVLVRATYLRNETAKRVKLIQHPPTGR